MEITIKNLQKKLPIHQKRIKSLILKILEKESVKKSGWINICLVTDPLIKKFNAKFHKTNCTTDVLSFNLNDCQDNHLLADIMISADTAIKQAMKFKTTADDELMLYIAHGLLHILGYNDRTSSQKILMRKKELTYVH